MILTETRKRIRCDLCRTATLARDGATARDLRRLAKAKGWRYVMAGGPGAPTTQDRCGRCAGGAS